MVDLLFAWIVEPISNEKLIYGEIERGSGELPAPNEFDSIYSVHKETKCGQLRSWNCFECMPMLSSEDAYNQHMVMHAATERECENEGNDFVPIIKSEIDLMDVPYVENGASMEDTCSVYIEDPILVTVKHEYDSNAEKCKAKFEGYLFNSICLQLTVYDLFMIFAGAMMRRSSQKRFVAIPKR